jgi:hypothetical protein
MILRQFRSPRGTADPLNTAEQRMNGDRRCGQRCQVLDKLSPDNHPLAVGLAVIENRGFGQ